MKSIIATLGLAAEATEEQVAAKCKELLASASESKSLREGIVSFAGEVGDESLKTIAASQGVEAVAGCLKTAAVKLKNPPGMVAASDYEALKTRLVTLESAAVERECDGLISARENEGKLPPAKVAWFREFYKRDAVAAREWMKEAPVLVSGSQQRDAGATPPAATPDRSAKIVSARAAYQADKAAGKFMPGSERSYVHGELRSAGLAGLTDEEAKTLAIAG